MTITQARDLERRATALGATNIYVSHRLPGARHGKLIYYVAFTLNGAACGPYSRYSILDQRLALIERARAAEPDNAQRAE